jgi:hypothetical protein
MNENLRKELAFCRWMQRFVLFGQAMILLLGLVAWMVPAVGEMSHQALKLTFILGGAAILAFTWR